MIKMSKEIRGVYFHLDAQKYDSVKKVQDIENIFKELSSSGISIVSLPSRYFLIILAPISNANFFFASDSIIYSPDF